VRCRGRQASVPAKLMSTHPSSAVVEGEIHHRSLAIEENAWFAGVSRPEEASASEATDQPSPIQFVPTDGNRQNSGTLEKDVQADTATG
jgi:cytoskeletal protein CcmA (bactofilin family)